jgi:hypothetical protein
MTSGTENVEGPKLAHEVSNGNIHHEDKYRKTRRLRKHYYSAVPLSKLARISVVYLS